MAALITLIKVSAQGSRSAFGDGVEHTQVVLAAKARVKSPPASTIDIQGQLLIQNKIQNDKISRRKPRYFNDLTNLLAMTAYNNSVSLSQILYFYCNNAKKTDYPLRVSILLFRGNAAQHCTTPSSQFEQGGKGTSSPQPSSKSLAWQ
jgi:hypothetical protein